MRCDRPQWKLAIVYLCLCVAYASSTRPLLTIIHMKVPTGCIYSNTLLHVHACAESNAGAGCIFF